MVQVIQGTGALLGGKRMVGKVTSSVVVFFFWKAGLISRSWEVSVGLESAGS